MYERKREKENSRSDADAMNAENGRTLRTRRRSKPLADRTNTITSAVSSSSSSSKPTPCLSKRSPPAAKRPRRDSLNPGSGNALNPNGVVHPTCTPLRNGRSSSRSGDKRQTVDKPEDKGNTVPASCEPINAKGPSTSLRRSESLDNTAGEKRQIVTKPNDEGKTVPAHLQPINVKDHSTSPRQSESLDNRGTVNCTAHELHPEDNQRQIMDRRKEKGKAVLVPFESILVNDPSTSRQYEYFCNPGTLRCATFEPLTVDDQRQTVEKTKNKEKTVSVSLETINTEGSSTSQQELDSLCTPGAFHCATFDPLRAEAQRQKEGKTVSVPAETINAEDPSTPRQHHNSSNNAGTGDCEVIKPLTGYTRRQRAERFKKRANSIALPLSCPPPQRSQSIIIGDKSNFPVGGSAQSKSCTLPHPKPKKKKLLLPKHFFEQRQSEREKDTLEQQRAYFSEIDKFELPEEVVSSSDGE